MLHYALAVNSEYLFEYFSISIYTKYRKENMCMSDIDSSLKVLLLLRSIFFYKVSLIILGQLFGSPVQIHAVATASGFLARHSDLAHS